VLFRSERPFRHLVDLARAAAAIEQAAAAQAMVRALGVTPEDVAPGGPALAGTGMDAAGLDLGTLARTALVARLLDGGETKRAAQPARFRPLTPDQVKAFEAMAKAPRAKDKAPKLPSALEKNARAMLTAAAPKPLAAAAESVATRWLATLAPLEPVLVSAPPKPRRK
jgi:hypothetical protein